MNDTQNQFSNQEMAELRTLFFSQAQEIMEELQEALLKLEAGYADAEIMKTIKRHIHTLKGDSKSIGFLVVGALCHRMEDVLLSYGDGDRTADPEIWGLLLSCADTLQRLLREAESRGEEGDVSEITARIESFLSRSAMPVKHRPVMAPLTEYQALEIEEARNNGLGVYDLSVGFHPQCGEKGVAALMIAQRLSATGAIIRSFPELSGADIDQAEGMDLVYSTALAHDEIETAVAIPGITGTVVIKEWGAPESDGQGAGAAEKEEKAEAQKSPQHVDMLRIEASRVDKIMNLVGELIIGRSMIDQVAKDLEEESRGGDAGARLSTVNTYLERVLRELQNSVMKMRMVPVNNVFRKFPKIVRDLSLEKGKRVRLEIQGKDAELDKSIVDALGEPLAHIVRNMVDHGIETPAVRFAAGKSEEGTITLRAFHEAAHIVIEASDDGRGLDAEKLKQKAVELGVLTSEEAVRLPEAEAYNLMFHSGLSTADTVTETSGRGVGMDAVRTAVQDMKGTIEILSETGKGTIIRLTLPLTLAVIKALLFDVGNRSFAIPVAAIAEVLRVMPGDLTSVDGKATLMLREQVVSLVSLADLFGIEGKNNEKQFALLIGGGKRKVGLLVDRLAGQQELVIKAVDERQTSSGLVAGASILGDGKVVLILDAPSVFRKAVTVEKERSA